MHKILVEEKKWISEDRFLHALNYCMLLPGPEAQQLAVYIGWLLHRTPGGLASGIIFILPGFISILILSLIYTTYNNTSIVQGIFYGIKAAVIAIVIEAVIRIGKRALKNNIMLLIAFLSFTAIFFFNIPFPIIIVAAGFIGLIGGKYLPAKFNSKKDNSSMDEIIKEELKKPSIVRSLKVLIISLVLWLTPLVIIRIASGTNSSFFEIGYFFSKAAVITFGGAYSVLAYIAQEAVNTYNWLSINQMMDGLGMAETTPGPLIMVVQFVGFLGAYNSPGTLNPAAAGILASILTTWVTFVPSFMWIFLGAPYIEYLRGNKLLSTALSAITSAVVGVILNLSIWFSLHTLFGKVDEKTFGSFRLYIPELTSLDLFLALITIVSFIALFKYKIGLIKLIWLTALAGFMWYLLF